MPEPMGLERLVLETAQAIEGIAGRNPNASRERVGKLAAHGAATDALERGEPMPEGIVGVDGVDKFLAIISEAAYMIKEGNGETINGNEH